VRRSTGGGSGEGGRERIPKIKKMSKSIPMAIPNKREQVKSQKIPRGDRRKRREGIPIASAALMETIRKKVHEEAGSSKKRKGKSHRTGRTQKGKSSKIQGVSCGGKS